MIKMKIIEIFRCTVQMQVKFFRIKLIRLLGLRVPYLRVGWNRQFLMMSEFGFVYDSSIVAPPSSPPIWPYTLDFQAPHTCTAAGQMCPTRSYQGIWEIPINPLFVEVNRWSFLVRHWKLIVLIVGHGINK